MASEVRVNKLTNRSGLGTATFNDDGSITVAGNLNLNNVTTAARNAGVGTATGSLIFDTTLGALMMYGGNDWTTVKGSFSASGGTLDTAARSGYNIHIFTSPGTFTVNSGTAPVEFLMVAGGGGGGVDNGGGGGGGEVIVSTSTSLGPGSYPITVGAGGAAAGGTNDAGAIGNATTFNSITARGGGGGSGAGGVATCDTNVGNGGGGAGVQDVAGVLTGCDAPAPGTTSGATYYGGNVGGTGTNAPNYNAGGGAGAGGNGIPGATATYPTTAGNGGPGTPSSILGTEYYWGGGGGGGSFHPDGNDNSGDGGIGGGGGGVAGPGMNNPGNGGPGYNNGGAGDPGGGGAGGANTGGGGGGNGRSNTATQGAGGSGIVVIAYQA